MGSRQEGMGRGQVALTKLCGKSGFSPSPPVPLKARTSLKGNQDLGVDWSHRLEAFPARVSTELTIRTSRVLTGRPPLCDSLRPLRLCVKGTPELPTNSKMRGTFIAKALRAQRNAKWGYRAIRAPGVTRYEPPHPTIGRDILANYAFSKKSEYRSNRVCAAG